jgi:hypothetical protein
MHATLRWLGLALALGAVSSCTSSGPISGQLAVPGQAAQRVTLTYVTDRFDAGGRITGTMPSGESFAGRFVQVTSTSTMDAVGPMWSSWSSPMWNDWGPFGETWVGGPADVRTFRTNYSGKVVATLFGDRGGVMRCRFRLVNPPGGMADGGTGECQLSTGGTLNAQF